jgi:hypothetical protein
MRRRRHYSASTADTNKLGGWAGFYKRGCQEKTLLPPLKASNFSGIQPLASRLVAHVTLQREKSNLEGAPGSPFFWAKATDGANTRDTPSRQGRRPQFQAGGFSLLLISSMVFCAACLVASILLPESRLASAKPNRQITTAKAKMTTVRS